MLKTGLQKCHPSYSEGLRERIELMPRIPWLEFTADLDHGFIATPIAIDGSNGTHAFGGKLEVEDVKISSYAPRIATFRYAANATIDLPTNCNLCSGLVVLRTYFAKHLVLQ